MVLRYFILFKAFEDYSYIHIVRTEDTGWGATIYEMKIDKL